MDLFAQSLVAAGARAPLGRAGLALPSAMFALVALSVLVVGLFAIADLSAKAVRNRQRSAHAVHIAEAGLAHAVGALRGSPLKSRHFTRILRGSDSLAGSLDDSLLIGWGLAANQQIPASGKTITVGTDTGRYYVTLSDDDADPDGNTTLAQKMVDLNGRLLARCRGVTRDGSVAEIEAIVGAIPFPGIVTDGDLDVSASGVQLSGACGGVHSNGRLLGSGSMTVTTKATEFQTGTLSTTPARESAPKMDVPTLNPLQYCAGADYVLKATGWIVYNGGADSVNASSTAQFGWKGGGGSPVKWETDNTTPAEGTFCVHGNAIVKHDIGSAAAPRKMSVIATGSIEVPAKPYLKAEQDDGIMLLAGGDVSINGDPGMGSNSTYDGMIYAGSDCKIEGAPTLAGQFICNNNPDPAGSINLTDEMKISGAATLRFDCSANVFNKRRVLFWYPKVGI